MNFKLFWFGSGYILINATIIKGFVCKFLNICIRNENLTISTIERVSSINDPISNQSEEEKGLIEVSKAYKSQDIFS